MKTIKFFLLFGIIFPALVLWGKDASKTMLPAALQNFYKVRLASVYDGDTFKVYLACNYPVFCHATPVRVKGIDSPEIRTSNACEKAKAKKARAFTKKFLESGKIYLKNCQRDKYFRLLCDVQSNKKDLATAILKAGLAVPYEGGTKQQIDWCEQNKESTPIKKKKERITEK